METRSKTAKAKSESHKKDVTTISEVRKVDNAERDATEDKLSVVSSSRSSRNDGAQSKSVSVSLSVRSNASIYMRKLMEVQVKADEKMAILLSKQFEMEKQMIENRLALEKARLSEKFDLGVSNTYRSENDNISFRNSHHSKDDEISSVDSEVKVRNWLQNTDVKNMTGKRSFHKSQIDNTHNSTRASFENNTGARHTHYRKNEEASGAEIRQLLARQSIDKDLPIFSGETIEWPSFYQQFLSTTNLLGLTDEENMCRLRKALKGDARRSVERLLLSISSIKPIIDILISRYGRADLIVKSLVNKAKNFPIMKNNDFRSLTHFAEDVSNLVVTLETMNMQNYLDCPQILEEILQKLPYNMQLSWGEKVLEKNGKSTLQEFKKWLWRKSEAASYAQSMNVGKPSTNQVSGKFSQNQPHKERFKTTLVTSQEKSTSVRKCIMCEEKHIIDKCKTFLDLSIDKKWDFVKSDGICFSCLGTSHRIKFCRNKKKCGVNNCEKIHHKSLHNDAFDKNKEKNDTVSLEIVAHTTKSFSTEILLKIAPVIIRSSQNELEIYALFDEASTVTLLDQDLADKMNLVGEETELGLKWTHEDTCKRLFSKKVSFEIADKNRTTFYQMENAYTVKDMDLPRQTVDGKRLKEKWSHLEYIDFASMTQAKPQLLIGQDNWDLITSREVIEGPKNSPALSKTKLGWIAHGNLREFRGRQDSNTVLHIFHNQMNYDEKLHEEIKNYFSTESFGVKISEDRSMNSEDKKAVQIIESVSRRIGDGDRWETGLLWRDDSSTLPESKYKALQRLQYLERRMTRDLEIAMTYKQKIEEYLEKDYAEKVIEGNEESSKVWYLPHFGVVNENKPGKLRFVFDAAAKVEGKCLNDFLLRGPDLLNSLVGVIFKYREKDVAFSADIRDMFHRIVIRKEDRAGQRFLWRNNSNEEPSTYEMKVLIFGSVGSPFSAQYIKNRNALEFQNKYPQAVNGIINRHYMDDYLDSVYTEEEAIRLIKEVIFIHRQGGFELRGWVCNSKEVYRHIPEELRGDEKLLQERNNLSQRILGLKWIPSSDHLAFSLNSSRMKKIISKGKNPTKRQILKIVMSLYDPLGLLAHYVIRAKILLQDIWRSGIGWDDEITHNQNIKCEKWIDVFSKIEDLKIPRCYALNFIYDFDLQLHIFCDASEQAFSAVGYFRFEKNENIHVSLVMARTQVAPLKPITIPRLELQAAVMGSRLAITIRKEHSFEVNQTHFWTDSKTVLCWLRSEPRMFKTFITHRVGEIQENTKIPDWHWIPSNLNIADEATRDTKDINLQENSQWFQGPEFLYNKQEFWPMEHKRIDKDEEIQENPETFELKHEFILLTVSHRIEYLPDITRFSDYMKLIRSTAYVFRFQHNIKQLGKNLQKQELTIEELKRAERIWNRKVQEDCFSQEYHLLMKNRPIQKSSKLYQLSPYMEDDIICLGGRTDNSTELSPQAKRPIILDNKHTFTRLLVQFYHSKNNHAGLQQTLNEIRQRFWILQARKLATKTIRFCNFYSIIRTKPQVPAMGQLPEQRLQKPPRAFTYTGMDYFGPMEVSIGRRKEKRYGVIFTCLSIRAIHIEIAESLTTDSAILAIRRFISRRGQPSSIWSDNGSNLTSANRELKEIIRNLDEDLIKRKMVSQEIDWKFIPLASPHMGGIWERMVRSVKDGLKKILNEKAPKQEVLLTLLAEVEHIVNSRPLTYVSSDGEDFESLTPNHFLIGTSSIAKPPTTFDVNEINYDLKKRWQFSQQLAEHFWNRWIREYIPTLTKRCKWFQEKKNVAKGDIVILMDNKLPRNNWPLGKIVDVHPVKMEE
ncbi:uncharacterized protein [Leptinotarsa decemlineata]|uniref:uncharacterized protein n=1 Tax=Leptinotarsa decemlineata TaxID=7539 RepID=UPI003D3062A8